MHIKSINLKNYRNYEELSVDLNKGINIFYGRNAQGKTNIIESIYLASTGKSHRTAKDSELIKWDTEEAKAKLEYQRDQENSFIEIHLKKNNKKQIKINGVRLSKTGELLGNLITVIFSPDHMKIIKEGPSERRRFVDIILSQVKPGYYYNLTQYLKVLEQRNNLLSEAFNNNELLKTIDIWDEQLIDYGARIINERQRFLKDINDCAHKVHHSITNGKEELKLNYKCSFETEAKEIADIKKAYANELNRLRKADYRRGLTHAGPHRDDLLFFINNSEVKTYGSQGQQRTTLLSLKISELEFLNNQSEAYPVLLLDDVFSELDTQRQSFLMKFVENVQTIITCTDVEYFNKLNMNEFSLFNVAEGRVIKKN